MAETIKHARRITVAFDSMIRSDYISLTDETKMAQLESYYIDFFRHLPGVLGEQDNYVSGRRGTGKTSLLLRAYLECLHSLNGTSTHLTNPVLPIYIDISQCRSIFHEPGAKTQIEAAFVQQMLRDILTQVRGLTQGTALQGSPRRQVAATVTTSEATQNMRSFLANFGGAEQTTTIRELLDILGTMRMATGVAAIYVFLDEFSDLSDDEQQRFSLLLRKFLGSKVQVYYKIAVITDHYNFGPYVRLQRDIFQVPLDLSDHVERWGGTVPAMKRLEEYTRQLVETRLRTFETGVLPEALFSSWDTASERLATAAMGVPRTLGVILQQALLQAQARNRPSISLADLNYGITHSYRAYARSFEGQIKQKIIPPFYGDMWRELRNHARAQRAKRGDRRPLSHFMVSEDRASYLTVLCENFLVHTLESNKVSRKGRSNHLFAFDRGVCDELNLGYAGSRYDLTHDWLIFDSELVEFDPYFTRSRTTVLRCPSCRRTYTPEEMMRFRVKRCEECDTLLEEEEGETSAPALYKFTEEERKIAGAVAMLTYKEAKSAREIADEVGCSVQKVAAFARVLKRRGMVRTRKSPSRNHQLYYLDD